MLGRFKTKIVICMLIAICVGAWLLFVNPRSKKYEDLKREAQKIEEEYLLLQAECVRMNQLVYDLNNSPKAVEKVAREKFGLCREDERLYKY